MCFPDVAYKQNEYLSKGLPNKFEYNYLEADSYDIFSYS